MKALFLILCLFSTNIIQAGVEDSYNRTTDGQKIAWMDKGKEAVKLKLKDSSSAQFRNIYFHRGADNIPMTCGEVNSKNSYGGYNGYQKFISAGNSDLTFLEEQVKDFYIIWNKFCQ